MKLLALLFLLIPSVALPSVIITVFDPNFQKWVTETEGMFYEINYKTDFNQQCKNILYNNLQELLRNSLDEIQKTTRLYEPAKKIETEIRFVPKGSINQH